jgi:putative phosphoesterase
MLIGILSDTHDQLDRTRRAVEMLRAAGAEMLFHCGDITEPPLVPICTVLPCYFVLGNNDEDAAPLEAAIRAGGGTSLGWGGEVALDGKRIAMRHGHLSRELKRLLAARPDYLLFGHSHQACDDTRDGIRRINPGALYRARNYSVALLDLASDTLKFLTVLR